MSIAAHKDPRVIAHGAEVLAQMRDLSKALVYAAILTDDGFEVVSVPSGAERRIGRMASMASSMQALSDAVARELSMGLSEYIIIATEAGYVIQLRIPGQTLVMSTKFDDSENLGKALSLSRLTATKLSALMSSDAS
jgi:predicted regulator of Ras-like GTPase activity (Roadblock/LC7/MglB family)